MKKTYTKQEFNKYVEKKSPKSKVLINTVKAFFVGGFICLLGQFITDLVKLKGYGVDETSNITVLIMVFLGAFLTGFNIYDEIGRFGGAGSIVPITGFANSIVFPAMEFKTEGYVMGVGAKMFIVAGPVLVYGISAFVIAGIFHYFLK